MGSSPKDRTNRKMQLGLAKILSKQASKGALVTQDSAQTTPLSDPAFLAGCLYVDDDQYAALANWNPWQADSLHHSPNDSQTARFCRKGVYLIGAPSNIAKEAFNGVGCTNVAMHDRREGIKGQEMLFIFHQAAHRFRIALAVLGFEGRQIQ